MSDPLNFKITFQYNFTYDFRRDDWNLKKKFSVFYVNNFYKLELTKPFIFER